MDPLEQLVRAIPLLGCFLSENVGLWNRRQLLLLPCCFQASFGNTVISQHCSRMWLPVGRDWRREGLTYYRNKGDRENNKGIKRLSLLSGDAAATRELAKMKSDYSPVFPVEQELPRAGPFLLTLQMSTGH